ncbi:MAG: hypothetical protein ICV63_14580 [Coleofasciculus sp. Co-bin14]|nr:hypothetical protein [Coleofasciculus sp. Co-bin14]
MFNPKSHLPQIFESGASLDDGNDRFDPHGKFTVADELSAFVAAMDE